MPAAIPAVIGAAATLYAGNQAKKGAQAQADAANRALDYSTSPRRTQYGSYVGPASGFYQAPQQLQAAPQLQTQPANTGLGSRFIGGVSNSGISNLSNALGSSNGLLGGALGRARPSNEQLAYIDPSIRTMREQSISNVPEYQSILRGQLGETMSGLGQTRGRLDELYGQTNDNAFLDPILQNLALQRGRLSQGMTQRGLGGSSFYSQALGNFEGAAAPGIAQARQQGISARQGLLTDLANNDVQSMGTASQGIAQLQNLDNLYANVAGQNLEQELAALGLNSANIAGILGASNQLGQAGQMRAQTTGNTLGALGSLIGGIKWPTSSPDAFSATGGF